MVSAPGYREKEIVLPDSLGEKFVPLARLQETQDQKLPGGKPEHGSAPKVIKSTRSKTVDLGNFLDNVAIFIGPGLVRFVGESVTTMKSPANRNFPLLNLYIEKPFPFAHDSAKAATATFRIPLSLQTFSRELDNLETGLDFSYHRPFRAIDAGLRGGLRVSYFDLRTAGIKSDWFSPLVTLGVELNWPKQWFFKSEAFVTDLSICYSHDFFAFDHYRPSFRGWQLARLKNVEAPLRRDSISLTFKTKLGVIRAGYSVIGPEIRTNAMRLKDISIVYISCDLNNAWSGD
jgi:hypothetical protein